MSKLTSMPATAVLIVSSMLLAWPATTHAESCVIDTVMRGAKSRECMTNKSMPSNHFHEFCTSMGKTLKDALKDQFDYSVTFPNTCPAGWVGYCDFKSGQKYVYNKAYVEKNKKGCTPNNPAQPGEWHEK